MSLVCGQGRGLGPNGGRDVGWREGPGHLTVSAGERLKRPSLDPEENFHSVPVAVTIICIFTRVLYKSTAVKFAFCVTIAKICLSWMYISVIFAGVQ